MKTPKTMLLVSFFALLLWGCKDDDNETDHSDCEEWDYSATFGPDFWSDCYSECSGVAQSPVDIYGTVTGTTQQNLAFSYLPSSIDLEYNGRTIEFDYDSGSSISILDKSYELEQFHFHTPSEHTINGVSYPMEIHLVHENHETSALAVISLLVQEGQENAFLSQFFSTLPSEKEEHYVSDSSVNIQNLLPTNPSYYTYSGSLTTPPCSEVVTWLVYKTPIEASPSQIDTMHDILGHNNRPIQPLHGRTVYEYNP